MTIEKFSNPLVVRLRKFPKTDLRKAKHKERDAHKAKSRVFAEGKIGRTNSRAEERDDLVMFARTAPAPSQQTELLQGQGKARQGKEEVERGMMVRAEGHTSERRIRPWPKERGRRQACR